jgi:hypothetical protein
VRKLREASIEGVIHPPLFAGAHTGGAAMSDEKTEGGGVTRLSFIKASAGVAAGMAAVGVPAAAALSGEEAGVPTEPSSLTPREPVVAYVRDAERGEVTVMSGTSERTYRDRALVKRMLTAAPQDAAQNGGIDVVAP